MGKEFRYSMQVNTKKYGGDALRSYKALMRKLSREGLYQELKEREFFKSKGQRKREEKVQGTLRVAKKQRLRMEHLAKELPIVKPKPKPFKQKK
jgi:ribosomal protein S21